ncbi:hypothetical protein K1V27_20900 [Syntrophobacteraceae bacterium DRH4]|nr:hypothetical protein [Desulfoferrobacter suflitae]MCK8604165.1 hypothetical protein [Desulfoferrobacter suflitae]
MEQNKKFTSAMLFGVWCYPIGHAVCLQGGQGTSKATKESHNFMSVLSSQQVRDPGLTHSKNSSRLCLRQAVRFNKFPKIGHKVGSHLKNGGFIRRIPQIYKYVTRRIYDLFNHFYLAGHDHSVNLFKE